MAFFSDLVRAIAEATGIYEMTITGFGQAARDAGFISKGGRGRSAAHMTVGDAANLIIAVAASPTAREVPDVIAHFRGIAPDYRGIDDVLGEDGLLKSIERGNRSFGESLEMLIHGAIRPVYVGPDLFGAISRSEGASRLDADIQSAHELFVEEDWRTSPELRIEFKRMARRARISLGGFDEYVRSKREEEGLVSTFLFDMGWKNPRSHYTGDHEVSAVITHKTIIAIAETIREGSNGK